MVAREAVGPRKIAILAGASGNGKTTLGLESLFAWALRSHFHRRREWPQAFAHLRVVRLRTAAEVDTFLAGAGAHAID